MSKGKQATAITANEIAVATETKSEGKAKKGYSLPQEAQGKSWEDLTKQFGSFSGAIRYLHSLGMSMGDIHRFSGKRFQHVRNVLVTPLKGKAKAE